MTHIRLCLQSTSLLHLTHQTAAAITILLDVEASLVVVVVVGGRGSVGGWQGCSAAPPSPSLVKTQWHVCHPDMVWRRRSCKAALLLCCSSVMPSCLLHKQLRFHLCWSTVRLQAQKTQQPPLQPQTAATWTPFSADWIFVRFVKTSARCYMIKRRNPAPTQSSVFFFHCQFSVEVTSNDSLWVCSDPKYIDAGRVSAKPLRGQFLKDEVSGNRWDWLGTG